MNFVIYNPNSKGGNFKYTEYTAKALAEKGCNVEVVFPPCNINTEGLFIAKPILCTDQTQTQTFNKIRKKLYFLFRIIANPFIFFFHIKNLPSSNILFNDFDQLTALLWTPLFAKLKKKHKFAVILHDPDRDAFPGGLKHTFRSMKAIMKIMDVAFFHEEIPKKEYYNSFNGSKVSIPHGIYLPAAIDKNLQNTIFQFKRNNKLLTIPGNIRFEKNYHLIIEALKDLPDCKLLIAGFPSSSKVNTMHLKKIAATGKVEKRILWLEKYLSENEFSTVINSSDLVLLYYKKSFTSQSGIFNQIAPFKKKVLLSKTNSAMYKVAKEFGIGTIVEPDNKDAFICGVNSAIKGKKNGSMWNKYISYASWQKQAERIINAMTTKTI